MSTDQFSSSCSHADDDYFDMEVSSSSSKNFICLSISSPPQSREFEFQMSSVALDRETATSPADELFYKGKLLPLHLPPRLQMVQKLLQNPSSTTTTTNTFEEHYSIPVITPSSITPFTNTTTTTNNPLESCNISPSEYCRVSCELNPGDYFFELSSESNSFNGYNHPINKKSWTKKLKHSFLGQKLKASSAYLKSLFSKSNCVDEYSCTKEADNEEPEASSKGNKYMKVARKNSFSEADSETYKIANTLMKSMEKEIGPDIFHSQRRSFSGAFQSYSTTKSLSSSSGSSSSSSFSFSPSNGYIDFQLLKRSSSANSEIEGSIEGAIAYCKKSHQQLFCARKAATEVGVCSLSASGVVACGDKERPKLCSI